MNLALYIYWYNNKKVVNESLHSNSPILYHMQKVDDVDDHFRVSGVHRKRQDLGSATECVD